MANQKIIKAVIQFRRGLAEDWLRVNPLLRPGEPGFELDTGLLKIGDGIHNWRDLDYINDGGEVDDDFSPISVHPVQNRVITQAIQSIEEEIAKIGAQILYGTTEYWDSLVEFIAQENVIYVYTDGFPGVHNIVRFKVGDGQTYLKELPYTDMVYYDHISDPTIHVSQADREFWNNKVSCYTAGENLVFTTGRV